MLKSRGRLRQANYIFLNVIYIVNTLINYTTTQHKLPLISVILIKEKKKKLNLYTKPLLPVQQVQISIKDKFLKILNFIEEKEIQVYLFVCLFVRGGGGGVNNLSDLVQ